MAIELKYLENLDIKSIHEFIILENNRDFDLKMIIIYWMVTGEFMMKWGFSYLI